MEKLCGKIYANLNAIASDLKWLQENSLIGVNSFAAITVLVNRHDKSPFLQ